MITILWCILLIGIFSVIPLYKKGIGYGFGIAYVINVVLFGVLFCSYYKTLESFFSAFIYAASMFTMGVNSRDILDMTNSLAVEGKAVFLILIWVMYILCPILTATTIIKFIKKFLNGAKLKILRNKNIFIFSEINEKTLAIARDIKSEDKKAAVVFANSTGEEYICTKLPPEKIEVHKSNNVKVIFLNENSNMQIANLKQFAFYEKFKPWQVYVITNNAICMEAAESFKEKTNYKGIRIVSPKLNTVRNILWEYPLYSNMENKSSLTVTVLGVGGFGSLFAKNALWCGILPDVKFKLNLVDSDTEENIERRVSENIKHNFFDVKCFNYDINTNKFFEEINKNSIGQSDYIMVSTTNDDLNIKIARELKVHFARAGRKPFIAAYIKESGKLALADILTEEGITLVGGIENMYSTQNIIDDKGINRAYAVYKSYMGNVSREDFYAQKQIDISSSYANAIHAKYKVFAAVGKVDENNFEENNKAIKENIEKLSVCEHNRWMAFEILKGYVGVDNNELVAFLEKNKNNPKVHIDHNLKIHACITPYENLDYLSKCILDVCGQEKEFKSFDAKLSEISAEIIKM